MELSFWRLGVPWSEFLPVFVRYAVGGPHAHLEDEDAQVFERFWFVVSTAQYPSPRQTLAQFLDFTMDGWVSVYELEVFLRGFGPLEGDLQLLFFELFFQTHWSLIVQLRFSSAIA